MADSVTSQFQAQLQAKLASASSEAQAQIYSRTGVDTNQARVKQGAQSALDLAQNGFNPDNPSDNAKLIHVISGGLCLIPGAGPILGAAVESLWQVGNVIDCPFENALASIGIGDSTPECGGQRCRSSGNWTAASIMASSSLPAMPVGSFASIVIPALAQYAAQNMNCKGGFPPGMIVDAVAAVWNQTHDGPALNFYIPPLQLNAGGGGPVVIATDGTYRCAGNCPTGNVDPVVFFAFQPVLGACVAYSGITDCNTVLSQVLKINVTPAATGILSQAQTTEARSVSLNAGPVTGSAASTARSVAGHATAIAAGGFAGGLLYAWATGKAVDKVMVNAWDILGGWIKGGLGAVEGGVRVATGAGENLGRRRRHAAQKRK